MGNKGPIEAIPTPEIIMKIQINAMKRTRIISLAQCAALCGASAAFGQGENQRPPPPPPLPPVIQALDTNHDGIIDANEIANAPQSLQTLLKSGSTALTIPDLLGPPRHRPPPPGWQNQGNGGGPQMTGTQNGPASPEYNQGGPPGPPPGPPPNQNRQGGHPRRPLPPVIQALDTNHDRIIDATEIANASQSLSTLLKSGSTELTIPDLLGPPPPRPPRGQGPGQGPGNDQDGPPGPPPNQNGPDGNPPPPPPDGQAPPMPVQDGTSGQNDGAPPPPPPPE